MAGRRNAGRRLTSREKVRRAEGEKPAGRSNYARQTRATSAGPGYFTIYKKGQGYWTRMGTVGGASSSVRSPHTTCMHTCRPSCRTEHATGRQDRGWHCWSGCIAAAILCALLVAAEQAGERGFSDRDRQRDEEGQLDEPQGTDRLDADRHHLHVPGRVVPVRVDQIFGWLMYCDPRAESRPVRTSLSLGIWHVPTALAHCMPWLWRYVDQTGFVYEFFVLRVASNKEDRVREALGARSRSKALKPLVGRILVPTERIRADEGRQAPRNRSQALSRLCLHRAGTRQDRHIPEKVWFMIKETDGVGDFIGSNGKPSPMTPKDEAKMLEAAERKEETFSEATAFKKGEKVKVTNGAVHEFRGRSGRGDRRQRHGPHHHHHLRPPDAAGIGILAGRKALIFRHLNKNRVSRSRI